MEARAEYCRRGGVGNSKPQSNLGVTVCFFIKQSLLGRGCGCWRPWRPIKQVARFRLQQRRPASGPPNLRQPEVSIFSGAAGPINGAFEEAALVTAGPALHHPLGRWILKADCPSSGSALLRHSSH